MKKRGKIIWATGISGSNRKKYYQNFLRFCSRTPKGRKNVKIYNAGPLLFEQARKSGVHLDPNNVLNADPELLSALRGAVLERVLGNLLKDWKIYDAVIVSLHSYFFWEECFSRAYNSVYIDEFNPDLFVTFIDHDEPILKRLFERRQWKGQRLNSQKILYWQNLEVESTWALAEERDKNCFVIPVRQPVQTLYSLIFEPWCEPLYFNVPMTHLFSLPDEIRVKELKKINSFVKHLWKFPFVVFNPFTVETGFVSDKDDAIEITRHRQTILRDLRWFVKQSKRTLAFFPLAVPSPGAFEEIFTSFRTTKDPWVIYPPPFSPFLVGRTTHPPFPNEKEFFKFLKNEYLPHRTRIVRAKYGVEL